MKKQKLPISLGLAFILFTYLVGAPIRANAGGDNVSGASVDSATTSGDTFSPEVLQPSIEIAPSTNVQVGDNGVSVSNEVQNSVNETAGNALAEASASSATGASIAAVLEGGASGEGAASQLQGSITGLGVSPASAQALVSALSGLAETKSAARLGIPVGKLQFVQLVASTKGIAEDWAIAQKRATPNVNINKLNAAITAYNQIVMESSPEVIQKLAKEPQFLEVGKLLKQLRAALNKS